MVVVMIDIGGVGQGVETDRDLHSRTGVIDDHALPPHHVINNMYF